MSLKGNQLRLLEEVTLYPAVLSRLGAVASGTVTESLPIDLLLQDVLEPDLAEETSLDNRFGRLLDEGETAAAQTLKELRGGDPQTGTLILRTKVKFASDIETTLRRVMGLLLILKDTQHPRLRELSTTVDALSRDAYLRAHRPGRLLQLLAPLERELEQLVTETLDRVRREVEDLRAALNPSNERDLSIALQRLDHVLQSPESLPVAQRLLALAKRALHGQLSPEDLKILHQEGIQRERLVRPRGDFPADVKSAADVLALLGREDPRLKFASEFERDKTRELFRALLPEGEVLNTAAVARRLLTFLGLPSEIPSDSYRGSLGSSFRIRIPVPRIPALRDGGRYFPQGIQLVVPYRTDESAIPKLLQDTPKDALRIVYFPGRLDRPLRQVFYLDSDVGYIDHVDLLRLGECLQDQRSHAFQQIILPRLPLERVKPYQGGGPVSPEMFRGRRDVIERLKQPRGGTVLFSGRMMGKSSILTKIHNDIQASQRAGSTSREFSVFISNAAEDLLTPLVEKLASMLGGERGSKFLQADRSLAPSPTLRPRDRQERARQRLANFRSLVNILLERRESHLTILLDEADRFAAADAERPRAESLAWLLRDLEQEMPDRLRVVFAGFQTIHHQVLFKSGAFANWFGLEQLGALAEEDAGSLVIEPFADFGFTFASRAGVDRIMEFTGRHPLLIQETCARLMERMAARRRGAPEDETILIQAGDVETVCRDDQLRDRVRQVLSLNLDEYPRLKLMVYLILFASGMSDSRRSLSLEEFKLDDLKETLIDFYQAQFNDYFDERSIGALVQELMALGLVSRRGDSYEFVNRTFAAMLQEDRGFDNELQRLLERVTNPDRSEVRRFFTLPNEDLERILRLERGHILVLGLPGTLRTFIANALFESDSRSRTDTFLLSARGCRNLEEVHDRLKAELKERRKTLSLDDLLVKNNIKTIVFDNVDELSGGGALVKLAQQLAERDLRMVAFGGPVLARHYVAELAAYDVDVVPLRRLRPQDIKAWGEQLSGSSGDFQIIFDEERSRSLAKVTGGYFPLLTRFKEFVRRRSYNAREIIPSLQDVAGFAKDLTPPAVEETLLAPLDPQERGLLAKLYEFASKEDIWDVEWEFIDEMVLSPLASGTQEPLTVWRDRFEVLRLLDLLEERPVAGRRKVLIAKEGPLHIAFKAG
jgi:hypothetical protein